MMTYKKFYNYKVWLLILSVLSSDSLFAMDAIKNNNTEITKFLSDLHQYFDSINKGTRVLNKDEFSTTIQKAADVVNQDINNLKKIKTDASGEAQIQKTFEGTTNFINALSKLAKNIKSELVDTGGIFDQAFDLVKKNITSPEVIQQPTEGIWQKITSKIGITGAKPIKTEEVPSELQSSAEVKNNHNIITKTFADLSSYFSEIRSGKTAAKQDEFSNIVQAAAAKVNDVVNKLKVINKTVDQKIKDDIQTVFDDTLKLIDIFSNSASGQNLSKVTNTGEIFNQAFDPVKKNISSPIQQLEQPKRQPYKGPLGTAFSKIGFYQPSPQQPIMPVHEKITNILNNLNGLQEQLKNALENNKLADATTALQSIQSLWLNNDELFSKEIPGNSALEELLSDFYIAFRDIINHQKMETAEYLPVRRKFNYVEKQVARLVNTIETQEHQKLQQQAGMPTSAQQKIAYGLIGKVVNTEIFVNQQRLFSIFRNRSFSTSSPNAWVIPVDESLVGRTLEVQELIAQLDPDNKLIDAVNKKYKTTRGKVGDTFLIQMAPQLYLILAVEPQINLTDTQEQKFNKLQQLYKIYVASLYKATVITKNVAFYLDSIYENMEVINLTIGTISNFIKEEKPSFEALYFIATSKKIQELFEQMWKIELEIIPQAFKPSEYLAQVESLLKEAPKTITPLPEKEKKSLYQKLKNIFIKKAPAEAQALTEQEEENLKKLTDAIAKIGLPEDREAFLKKIKETSNIGAGKALELLLKSEELKKAKEKEAEAKEVAAEEKPGTTKKPTGLAELLGEKPVVEKPLQEFPPQPKPTVSTMSLQNALGRLAARLEMLNIEIQIPEASFE